MGTRSLDVNTTSNDNVTGHEALRLNTTGTSNTVNSYEDANTTASNNTAIGYQSLTANTTVNHGFRIKTLLVLIQQVLKTLPLTIHLFYLPLVMVILTLICIINE